MFILVDSTYNRFDIGFSSDNPVYEKLTRLKVFIGSDLVAGVGEVHPTMIITDGFLFFLSDLYIALTDTSKDDLLSYESVLNEDNVDYKLVFDIRKKEALLTIAYTKHFNKSDDFDLVKSYVEKMRNNQIDYNDCPKYDLEIVEGNIADFFNISPKMNHLAIRTIWKFNLDRDILRSSLPKLMYLVENNKELEDQA